MSSAHRGMASGHHTLETQGNEGVELAPLHARTRSAQKVCLALNTGREQGLVLGFEDELQTRLCTYALCLMCLSGGFHLGGWHNCKA